MDYLIVSGDRFKLRALDKAVETALLPPVAVIIGPKSDVNESQETRFFVMSSEVSRRCGIAEF